MQIVRRAARAEAELITAHCAKLTGVNWGELGSDLSARGYSRLVVS